MAAGGFLFGDLLLRCRHAEVFYAGQGVTPRQLFLDQFVSWPFPTLHLANDSYPYQLGLLLLQAAAALLLALGYRTRAVSVLCWLGLLSLHQRNPLVLNSGDALLLMLLFWGMFLPWGKRWSLDERAARRLPGEVPEVPGQVSEGQGEGAEERPDEVCSAASVGWCLQMVCLYLFAALHKLNPVWLSDGNAVLFALKLSHHATPFADWLTPYPDLLKALSRLVVTAELGLALSLLAPWPRWRTVVLTGAALMHLGFGLFLAIGIFRYAPLVGLLGLLPVGRLARWKRAEGPVAIDLRGGRSLALLAVSLLVWAVNLESLGRGQKLFLPPLLGQVAPLLVGPQSWGVFAGPGLEQSGWFALQVQARDGRSYDAWWGDREFSDERPERIAASYPDDRWRKYMLNLAGLPPHHPYQERFVAWAAGAWDRRHGENPAHGVSLWYVAQDTSPGGEFGPARWTLLARFPQ